MKKTERSATRTKTAAADSIDREGLELAPALFRLMRGLRRGDRKQLMSAIEAECERIGQGTLFHAAMECTPPTSAPNPIERSELWLSFAGSPDPAARARALAVLTVLKDPDDIEVIEAMAARLGPSRQMFATSTRAACAAATAQQIRPTTH